MESNKAASWKSIPKFILISFKIFFFQSCNVSSVYPLFPFIRLYEANKMFQRDAFPASTLANYDGCLAFFNFRLIR